VDGAGNVFVAEGSLSGYIRKISPGGVVTTFAGSTQGGADGTGSAAQFDGPSGLVIDNAGVIYVADTANDSIRRSLQTSRNHFRRDSTAP